MKFICRQRLDGRWMWEAFSRNGQPVARSPKSTGHPSRAAAFKAACRFVDYLQGNRPVRVLSGDEERP